MAVHVRLTQASREAVPVTDDGAEPGHWIVANWCRDDDAPARLGDADKLGKDLIGIGEVFYHLAAQDEIARSSGNGDVGRGAD